MMLYYPASALVNCVTGAVIFALCLVKNRSPLNRSLAYFSAAVAFWSICYFFWQISESAGEARFWCVWLIAGAIMITPTSFHFSATLINEFEKYKKQILAIYVLAIIFLLINLTTDWLVATVEPILEFPFWPMAGRLFWIYLVYFLGTIGYSLFIIYRHWEGLSGIKRNQVKYVFFGFFFAYLGGATNFFLWYRIPIPPVGNIGVSLLFLLSFYAIAKYQLMDIRIAVTRVTVFFLVYLPLLGIPYLLLERTQNLYSSLFLMWIMATIGPLILRSVQKRIEDELFQEKELLYRASIIDPLTKVYNRTFFEARFMIEVERARTARMPLTMLLIDVDKFKQVNDTYGHLAGDELLRKTAAILKETVRETDMVVRYGGDEFIVLLPGAGIRETREPAVRILQQIRRAALHVRIGQDSVEVKGTVSIGMAELRRKEKEFDLFRRADHALYEAKSKGGNEVAVL